MRIRKNGKVVTLTESDLRRIVKRVISEQTQMTRLEIPGLGDFKATVDTRKRKTPSIALQNSKYGTVHAKYDCDSDKVTLHPTNQMNVKKQDPEYEKMLEFMRGFNDSDVAGVKKVKDQIKNATAQYCGTPEKPETKS
jgi:hypothetical protein